MKFDTYLIQDSHKTSVLVFRFQLCQVFIGILIRTFLKHMIKLCFFIEICLRIIRNEILRLIVNIFSDNVFFSDKGVIFEYIDQMALVVFVGRVPLMISSEDGIVSIKSTNNDYFLTFVIVAIAEILKKS